MKNDRAVRIVAAYGRCPYSAREYTAFARKFLEERFAEDAGTDVTVDAVIREDFRVNGIIRAKQPGVLAGLEEVKAFYARHGVTTVGKKRDGQELAAGDVVATVSGRQGDLLRVERTGLNLLQRMSGIATQTRRFVAITESFGARIVGTRKTLLHALDKKAITLGGGLPHRYGLFDAILIKDNHLEAIAQEPGIKSRVATALSRAFAVAGKRKPSFIEIEAASGREAIEAAKCHADLVAHRIARGGPPFIIMLDNLSPGEIRRIVERLKTLDLFDGVLLEASGGIDQRSLARYAASGVDVISVGALTHSVTALDISQKIVGRAA